MLQFVSMIYKYTYFYTLADRSTPNERSRRWYNTRAYLHTNLSDLCRNSWL